MIYFEWQYIAKNIFYCKMGFFNFKNFGKYIIYITINSKSNWPISDFFFGTNRYFIFLLKLNIQVLQKMHIQKMKNEKTTKIFGFEKKKIFKFFFCSKQKIFFCTLAMRIFCSFQMLKNVKIDKVRALTKTCFFTKRRMWRHLWKY